MITDINNNPVSIGDIVKFHTVCFWNGCSGQVSRLEDRFEELVIVTMPDGKTKMAFNPNEVEVK